VALRDSILELKQRMQAGIIGQDEIIDRLLIALLADGHVLMEGLPGLAKTRSIKTLAIHLEATFRRIQFTPDLLPADVTGSDVYYSQDGEGKFRFQEGPVFGNLVLADEINRAPAKVQSALLEAMEERQVTVAGQTHPLPPLFLVLATQNPIEQEGTYPLPEAQMDRFLMHVVIRYPSDGAELEIMRLVRGEETKASSCQETGTAAPQQQKLSVQTILDARAESRQTHLSESIEKYIVALVSATRFPDKFGNKLKTWIQVGASPRGTLALDRTSRAWAWLAGRDHVLPDDVRSMAAECLRHRLILSYDALADGITADHVIQELLTQVAVA